MPHRWMFADRVSPIGARRPLAAALFVSLLAAGAMARPAVAAWAGFGPGGGSVVSLAVDPTDPATVFAAAGSLYRSADGGVTWQAAGPGPGDFAVAVDPAHPATVYTAGTEIARSRDGGHTWRVVLPSSPRLDFGVRMLAISPSGAVFAVTPERVLRSVDSGRTWTEVLSDANSVALFSVQVHPTDPSRVYAVSSTRLWQSADGGDTWTESPSPPNQGFPGFETVSLALSASSPSTLYAAVTDFLRTEILRSDDGGASWQQIGEIQALVERALVVDPTTSSRVYAAGTGGVYASGDGGASWQPLRAGLPTSSGHPLVTLSLAVAPSQPAILYAAPLEWGVARTANRGARWQIGVEAGLDGGVIEWLKFHPLRQGTVYVGQAAGQRTFRSTDGGRSWVPFARDLAARGLEDLAFDPGDPDVLYAAGGFGIAKSTDGGEVWKPLNGTPAFRLAVLGRQTLLAGTCGLARSTDGGRTWKQVIPCLYANPGSGNDDRRATVSLWTDPRDSRTAYVHFVLTGGIHDFLFQAFKSVDGGATWTSLRPPAASPSALAVAPGNDRILYVIAESHLFRSEDGGTTWKTANAELPPSSPDLVTPLAVDAADPHTLYLGSLQGLLISHDGGRTLERNDDPLPGGKVGVSQLWTDRTRPRTVFASSFAGASDGGLFIGHFE